MRWHIMKKNGLVDIFWRNRRSAAKDDPLCGQCEGAFWGKMRFGFCAQCDLRHSLDFGLKTRRWKGFESLRRHLQISVQSGFRWNWSRCSYRRIRGLLALSYELGITKVVLPEFDEMMRTGQETPHHMYSVGMHTLKAVEQVRADKVLRLTMLLHDVAKPQMKTVDADGVAHFKMHDVKGAEVAKRILKRLKFDNDTLGKVTKLVQYHDYRMPAQPKNVRRAMNKIGEELFPYYLEIRKADTMAQSEYMREEKLSNIAGIERCYKEILKKKECVSLKMLAVSGSDLIADGMQPGKQIGAVLQALLELVIEQPEYNTKEILLEQSRKLRKETLL